MGNINAVTYKEFFPLFKENKVWMGPSITSGDRKFYVPDDYPLNAAGCGIDACGRKFIRVKGVRWFTNLDHAKRHEKLVLCEPYVPEAYSNYVHYDAINIDRVKGNITKPGIPYDYDGVMGVPVTFLDVYNPEQFELMAFVKRDDCKLLHSCFTADYGLLTGAKHTICSDGKSRYARLGICLRV